MPCQAHAAITPASAAVITDTYMASEAAEDTVFSDFGVGVAFLD